jgi:hypothetical protein
MSMTFTFLKRIFDALIQSNQVVLYIALSDEDYFRVAGLLQSANIRYKVKSPFDMKMPRGTMFSTDRTRTYEIYVKREDEHKAQKAIWHPING